MECRQVVRRNRACSHFRQKATLPPRRPPAAPPSSPGAAGKQASAERITPAGKIPVERPISAERPFEHPQTGKETAVRRKKFACSSTGSPSSSDQSCEQ